MAMLDVKPQSDLHSSFTYSIPKLKKGFDMEYTPEKIELIKKTVCKGATNDELELFLHFCTRTGLDPLARQIWSVARGNQRTIQVSIDGLRLVADRTGQYAPGEAPAFSYDERGRLVSATSFVKKLTQDGVWHTVSANVFMEEFDPGTVFWKKMPRVMLSKVAEAHALRKAFPMELSGIYAQEEMEQAGNPIEIDAMEIDAMKIDSPLKVSEKCKELEAIEALIEEALEGREHLRVRVLKAYGVKHIGDIPSNKLDSVHKRILTYIEKEKELNECSKELQVS